MGQWQYSDLTALANGGTLGAGDPLLATPLVGFVVGTDGHILGLSSGDGTPSDGVWSDVTAAAGVPGYAVIADATAGTGDAPCWLEMTPTFAPSTSASFDVFSTVPGDVTSYAPTSWNTRMQQIASAWNSALPPNAPASDRLYVGENYVTEVIVAAVNGTPGAVTLAGCLWNGDYVQTPAYSAVNANTVETSWTLDGSFYAGFGWGGLSGPAAGIAGLVDNQAFTFMVGTTIHLQTTDTDERRHGVGDLDRRARLQSLGSPGAWQQPPGGNRDPVRVRPVLPPTADRGRGTDPELLGDRTARRDSPLAPGAPVRRA